MLFTKQSLMFLMRVISIFYCLCLISEGHFFSFAVDHENTCISILATADLQGAFVPLSAFSEEGEEEAGRIARLTYLIRKFRRDDRKKVLLISSGDDFMGRFFYAFDGKATIDIMNRMGYDVMALGNHEFDKGIPVLIKAVQSARFPILCGNLSCSDSTFREICSPWTILEVHGVKIGLFSLMTENIAQISSAPVKLVSTNHKAATKYIQLLKNKSDLIIAVTHIGLDADIELARSVPGIDVIVGGHSHGYLHTPVRINKTWIINGGERGTHLPCLDIPLSKTGHPELDRIHYTLFEIKPGDPFDKEIDTLVEQYWKRLPETTILGHTSVPWQLGKDALRYGESSVADLITDLIRDRFKVDIVFQNAGAIRGRTLKKPGPLTDVFFSNLDEFRNEIVLIGLKGEYIKPVLERSAASFGTGGWLHVSGLRLTLNLEETPQQLNNSGNLSGKSIIRKGNRVKTVFLLSNQGGIKMLEPEKTYQVALNRFLYDRLGDGYFWFKRYGTNPRYTMMTVYGLLVSAALERKHLDPPPVDKRLVIEG